MIKQYHYTRLERHHKKVLIYLVLVLVVFAQQQPYQELIQEPAQESFKSVSKQQLDQPAIVRSSVDFQDVGKLPSFSGLGSFQFSSSDFSSCLWFEGQYQHAYKIAQANFLKLKPVLIKRWQVEHFSKQTYLPFLT